MSAITGLINVILAHVCEDFRARSSVFQNEPHTYAAFTRHVARMLTDPLKESLSQPSGFMEKGVTVDLLRSDGTGLLHSPEQVLGTRWFESIFKTYSIKLQIQNHTWEIEYIPNGRAFSRSMSA